MSSAASLTGVSGARRTFFAMAQRTVDWPHELLEQLEFYWNVQFRPRLDGLTDDEYLWEPCDGCWSIRPQPDGTTTADLVLPEPDPPPFTTIAWRLGHMATGVLGSRAHNHFGDHGGEFDRTHVAGPATATAEAGIAALDAAYAAWHDGIDALGLDGHGGTVRSGRGPVRRAPDGGARAAHQPRGDAPRRRGPVPPRPLPLHGRGQNLR